MQQQYLKHTPPIPVYIVVAKDELIILRVVKGMQRDLYKYHVRRSFMR